jgi:hypothetical protein
VNIDDGSLPSSARREKLGLFRDVSKPGNVEANETELYTRLGKDTFTVGQELPFRRDVFFGFWTTVLDAIESSQNGGWRCATPRLDRESQPIIPVLSDSDLQLVEGDVLKSQIGLVLGALLIYALIFRLGLKDLAAG